ncbi:MAG TPA: RNase adapter RapZ [Desertimonas sp.]|nr:RNase adapter RapZ [Desertimonas sp.]
MADIAVITGLSGAGRSGVADVMEDLGWYVVDNLPTSLIEKVVELASLPGSSGIDRLALVAGRNHSELLQRVAAIRAVGHRVTLVFLDASSNELIRRYDATRRKHPLAADADGLLESIELERGILQATREAADLVIDTTGLNIHQLKERVVSAFSDVGSAQMQIAVESFGFKHGLPMDADIVMDVRFLPNPFWDEQLRPLTGHDPAVRDFVLERSTTSEFLDSFDAMLRTVMPGYQSEGRSYLTIAIGCTGGRHRSVAIVEEIADRLRGRGLAVRTSHRDVAR